MSKLFAIFLMLSVSCLLASGCASSTRSAPARSAGPQLFFRGLRSTEGGTWAAFELVNPIPHPIWVEGFDPENPLERWEQQRADGTWVDAPGPISATGAEPELVPPRTSVWIKKRVFPEDHEDQATTLRLGVREMREGAGHFSNGQDMIWSTPMRVPATRPVP